MSKQIDLSQMKAKLTPAQLSRLEERLDVKVVENVENGVAAEKLSPEFPRIDPDPQQKHEPFPLTDVQQAYLIGRSDEFTLGNVACQVYYEFDVTDLHLELFDSALQQMIDRHDMLRAVIHPNGSQQILPHVPRYEIAVTDLRGIEEAERERSLRETRERMSRQMMKLEKWPLFEVAVSRLDELHIRLHISFDVLIIDGLSIQILLHELALLYQDPQTNFPALTLSFRDYVLAERSLRGSDLYRRAQAYWFDRLESLPPAPELPLATDPATISKPRFVQRAAALEASLWAQLKTRSKQAGLTPSGVVLAAFAEVLTAWTKTPRFTLNLTLFNRLPLHEEINQIVGDFTEIGLLAVEGTGTTFAERARAIQQQLWQDIEHSLFSGVGVLRELTRRYGAQRAAMPIVFTSHLNPGTRGDGDGASINWLGQMNYAVSQTPQVWLDHQVSELDGKLSITWDAVEDLFHRGMLDDMFEAYLQLLRRLSTEEAAWEDAALCLTARTHLALQHEVNATGAPLSSHLLHTLFAAQAQRQPAQVAVISSECTLTYQELERRAHQVGHRLLRAGVKRNELVAVVMEKGWEQVVAVLGIHYAGAAYLPVEAGVPAARLGYLLTNGKVRVALTQRRVDEQATWPSEVEHWCVDREEEWVGAAAGAPEVEQEATDLAYVIYTSGSTGEPKGVMIDHRGAVNTIEDINERFGVKSGDRVLALSSLSFDLSVYDIFGLLAAGGAVVIPEGWASRDPGRWVELMREHGVSVWNSVPALMQMLVTYLEERGERLEGALRLALLSGDWIGVGLPEQIRAVSEGVEVISLGGATEASIWSIMYPIREVGAQWKSIPYGQAMRNQEFYVLDERQRERPVWAVGQLYIGGIGVALGYWGDAERTRERFVEVAGIGGATKRLYRTGDMGRWQGDGNIEFLGREDTQVKVQGYRIELGEVEAALVRHEAVAEAVVVAVGEARGDKRLVAYVVTAAAQPLSTDELREFLRQFLPEYMVPLSFMYLDKLPLSANGKVDRKALPAPVFSTPKKVDTSNGNLPANTAHVAQLVARVMKLEEIDPRVNLFDLGVNSIELVRIANLLENEYGFRPRIDELVRLSTVEEVARYYAERIAVTKAYSGDLGPTNNSSRQAASHSFEVLLDPEEREAFKDRQLALRRRNGQTAVVTLPREEDAELLRTYAARRSVRQFSAEKIPLPRFNKLISCLRQSALDGKPKYLWGSAGGLYPVQVYLYLKPQRVEGLDGGIYYYDPVEHQLDLITRDALPDKNMHSWVNQPVFEESAFSIFLVGQLRAIGPMYGELSRDFCLVEAGLITQLLELFGPSNGIGLCQIGTLDVEKVRQALALEESQIYLHSLLGGQVVSEDEQVSESEVEEDWVEGAL